MGQLSLEQNLEKGEEIVQLSFVSVIYAAYFRGNLGPQA